MRKRMHMRSKIDAVHRRSGARYALMRRKIARAYRQSEELASRKPGCKDYKVWWKLNQIQGRIDGLKYDFGRMRRRW